MAAGDLTTLSNVRAYLQKPASDTDQDAIIGQLITRASVAVETHTGREFHNTTGQARTFNYFGGGRLALAPYELRTLTTLRWDTDTATPTTATTSDYWYEGRGPTYPAIMLPGLRVTDTPGTLTRRVVEVTGDWGFATVPADVEQAVIVTVAIWLRRDVAAFSTTFSIDEGRLERPEALPSSVRSLLSPYRVPGIA